VGCACVRNGEPHFNINILERKLYLGVLGVHTYEKTPHFCYKYQPEVVFMKVITAS
jgi:hypothetical protein